MKNKGECSPFCWEDYTNISESGAGGCGGRGIIDGTHEDGDGDGCHTGIYAQWERDVQPTSMVHIA